LETNHEDSGFCPHDATDDVAFRCRIGAAKTNYGLRSGQWSQDVLRDPWKRRAFGGATWCVYGDLGDWEDWVNQLSKTRKVVAVEMQGHGRTGDIDRDITYENLSDDVAGLLDYLKIPQADVMGYSLGGGVAMECAIRHPEKVRKVVVISAPLRRGGWVKEANDAWLNFTWEVLKGTPAEVEWKKMNPNPNGFPDFFNHIKAAALRPYDFGADKLKATRAPMFFINGDADGVRLDHIAEMYRLKGGEVLGDIQPRSESRLAIIPNTTHVTLMSRMSIIVPIVNDFLDAKPLR
jgi:pimeloyl-ACP methyl ester carboxylesterase